MIKWLDLPDSTKRNAFIQIAEETGMNPFAVEKDWWVSRILEIIFQMDIAKHLVFKGGTSLSKACNSNIRFLLFKLNYSILTISTSNFLLQELSQFQMKFCV